MFSDDFARVIEAHRKRQGLSRNRLAEMSGLHQTYIGLLEKGKRSPNLDTAKGIAKGLGMPLWKLVKEAEER